jgi:transposase
MYQAIISLWQNGRSKRSISRDLGHDIKTVRKIIKKYEAIGKDLPDSIKRTSKCDFHKEQIESYISLNYSNRRIYELLRSDHSLTISYSTLTNYTRKLKISSDICVRFTSIAGEEGQVDFGYVGKQPCPSGKLKKAWVFNMRLSYSRLDYYEVVFDQRVETFIQCHKNAFCYFGGVPKTVKIDNLKSAVIEASFYEPVYQPLYKGLSDHYAFEIVPCRVRKPQEKGKVESGIKYIKNNFFVGRNFKNNSDLNKQLLDWLNDYCNSRIHGTTRLRPIDLFNDTERAKLTSLPDSSFNISMCFNRKVHKKDCHISIFNNYYSVPYEYADKEVNVELSDKIVRIYYNGNKICSHTLLKGKGEFSTNLSHYPKHKICSPDNRDYIHKNEAKMKDIGNFAAQLFNIIIKESPNMWRGQVRGILSLSKHYSDEVIDLSCKRAIHFGAHKYSQVKNICKAGTYNLPLESNEELINLKTGAM